MTAVPRWNSSAVSLWTGAKTVAMATFTQTSIGPQLAFNSSRRGVHGFGIGHIGRNRQGTGAQVAQFGRRALEPLRITR